MLALPIFAPWARYLAERNIRRQGVLYQEDFLPPAECDLLIAAFERCRHLTFLTPSGDSFFDHRYIWFTTLPEAERPARRAMQRARRRIVEATKRFYREGELYSDSVQLVVWPDGVNMPPHADSAHPDGSPHPTPWRDYASVVYLNDGYEGGEIYFPNLGLRFTPKKGLLLAFKGGLLHSHGVEKITRGPRYTMPAWYTRDPRHKDASEEMEV
jgi:hypothetical protein